MDRIKSGIQDVASEAVNGNNANSIEFNNAGSMEIMLMKKFFLGVFYFSFLLFFFSFSFILFFYSFFLFSL